MQILTDLLASGWQWLVAIAGLIIAAVSIRKTATVKTQAAADVAAAKKETSQVQQRIETIRVASNAQKTVSSASSSSVDQQLLDEWTRDNDN